MLVCYGLIGEVLPNKESTIKILLVLILINKIAVLFLLLASTFIMSGCSLYGGTQNNPTNTGTKSTPTQVSATGSTTVNIQNFAFNPRTSTIKKGSTVTWTNNDSVTHQIKSDTFNSTPLSTGQSFSFTFTTAGTYAYSCAIHPSMTGQIIVE